MRAQLSCMIVIFVVLVGVSSPHIAPATTRCAVKWTTPHTPQRGATVADFNRVLSGVQTLEVRSLIGQSHPTTGAPFKSRLAPSHPFANWYVLRFASDTDCATAVKELVRSSWVEAVEEIRTIPLNKNPSIVPRSLTKVPWNVDFIRARQALNHVQPDSTLIVAVIDTGADLNHPDLRNQLWHNDDPPGNASTADDNNDQNGDGWIEEWEKADDDDNGYVDDEFGFDFTDAPDQAGIGDATERDADPTDENGHGTHVAGIIAAHGGLEGVAPFVQLMPIRAAFNTPFGGAQLETDDAAAAIVYAVDNGARILNLSWGDHEESRLIREAIGYAVSHDVLVVAAAGNSNRADAHYPSSDPRVLGVVSVNRSGERSGFSNFGPGVTLAAPGEEFAAPGAGILSLEPLDLNPSGRGERRGTSMAAPHVVGAAAILMSRADRPSAQTVRALLVAGAQNQGQPWNAELGAGRIDVLASVQLQDDLVVQVTGPAQVFRQGRIRLQGTILSGDLWRYRITAIHLATLRRSELLPWSFGQRLNEPLLNISLSASMPGAYEYIVRAETVDGRTKEVHGLYTVDFTPPGVDTLFANLQWRAERSEVQVSVRMDEPVRLSVFSENGALLNSSGGFSILHQLSIQDMPNAPWTVRSENQAGEETRVSRPPPARLPAWPQPAAVNLQRQEHDIFVPEPVVQIFGSGDTVVWGRGRDANGFTTAQAWGYRNGVFELHHDLMIQGRPVAVGDVNGDGVVDVLLQSFRLATWVLSRQGQSFADQPTSPAIADRVLGLFQLDDDPELETILSSGDSLFLHDDWKNSNGALMQVLVNPSDTGFNVFGADAAVADVDGDGRVELVCGDGEGFVSVFEKQATGFVLEELIDTHGSYAYDVTALPQGGFLVGRQRTESVTGDGFPGTTYEFLHYFKTTAQYDEIQRFAFASPTNALSAASSITTSTLTGESFLSLVRGIHYYVMRWQGSELQPYAHWELAAGTEPLWGDFGNRGATQVLLPQRTGFVLFDLAEPRSLLGPLVHESLGPDSLRLTWQGLSGALYRVFRLNDPAPDLLAQVIEPLIDLGGLSPFVPQQYFIEATLADGSTMRSRTITAQSQRRPQLRGAKRLGEQSVQLDFSQAMRSNSATINRFKIVGEGVTPELRELQWTRGHRSAVLLLAENVTCGVFRVEVDRLRDTQGGLLDPPHSQIVIEFPCPESPFMVQSVEFEGRDVLVQFSKAAGDRAQLASSYLLHWNEQRIALGSASFEPDDSTRVRLSLMPSTQLVGRGIAYRLKILGVTSSAGQVLSVSETVFLLHPEGTGEAIFVYPNPVRPEDHVVTFADVSPGSRVRILNLEGELVREVSSLSDGGLKWDLRTQNGRRVRSGAYLYVVYDSKSTHQGVLAIKK